MRTCSGMLVVLLGVCFWIPSANAADASGYQPGETVAAPATIEEAMTRLENVLGKYEPKANKQFRFALDSSEETKPAAGEPSVFVVSKGAVLFGVPFRVGNAVAFDIVETTKRKVYDKPDESTRKVVRTQERFYTLRIVINIDETRTWDFQGNFVSHSIPNTIDKNYVKGRVNWKKDGFELVGLA